VLPPLAFNRMPSRRRSQRISAALGALLLTLASCTATTSSTTTTTTTTQPTTSSITATPPSVPTDELPCLSGGADFVESGGAGIIERDDSDANIVSGVRWSVFEECERVVIDFAASSGAPAVSPPGVGPLFIRPAGVLRLQLDPVVTRSAFMDQVIEGNLVTRAYVVRRSTNDIFIDLHLSQSALVRVNVVSGPARVVVDVRPGGEPYRALPVLTDNLVVIDPVDGSVVFPFTVNGYSRGGESEIAVTISSGGTEEVHTGAVGAGGDAWGAFTVLVPDGPTGPAAMIIGDRIPITVDLS
jgi:hypothetical protein